MKVYIAGPMTGLPAQNFPSFDKAEALWLDAGWKVVSPPQITRKYWRDTFNLEFDPVHMVVDQSMYNTLFRLDAKALIDCDAIALLPGWVKSKGARRELHIANALELRVFDAITLREVG